MPCLASRSRSTRPWRALGVPAALVLIAACDPYRPLPLGGREPVFVEGPCPAETAPGYRVRCGSVQVPQTRGSVDDPASADGREIALAVFVVASQNPSGPADPVAYLEGGPGGAASDWLPYLSAFAPVLDRRTLVLIDQRGTGRSQPALLCKGDDLATCRARLTAAGADLAAYHTAAIAADFEHVRRALRMPAWNLLGVSYGTRLALGILRDFPQGVRSAILDSVAPPERDWLADTVPAIERSFTAIFAACRADARCAAAYPDLEKAFYGLVDALDAQPAQVTVGGVATTVDGTSALNLFFLTAYDPDGIAALPELVFAMREGDFSGYAIMTARLDQAFSNFADGMYLSVTCRDVAPFSSAEEVARKEATARPRLAAAFGQAGTFASCESWGVPPSPAIEHQAVASPVPALVLAGSFDPITPPSWSRGAADHLSAGFFFERPDAAHGVFFTDCGADLVRTFLDDPSVRPAPACAADGTHRLAFSIPDKRLPSRLVQAARTAAPLEWARIADRVAAAARAHGR